MQNIKQIKEEIKTWKALADTLTYPHQQSVKNEILQHIIILKDFLKSGVINE